MGTQKPNWFMILAFILYYPKFLTLLVNVSDIILTVVRTLIVTLGVPVVLVLVMQVEQPRISHGIQMFDADLYLSGLAATVLVVLNTILEFLVVYVEDKENYHEPRKRVFSLWTLWEGIRYRVGLDDPRDRSPAAQYEGVLTIVTYAILFLALMGSMKEEMQDYKGEQWTRALGDILTQSDLPSMMTWISSLIFAFTLVYAVQALSRYVAVHTTAIIKEMGNKASSIQSKRIEEEQRKVKDYFDPETGDPRVKRISPTHFRAVCPDCNSFDNSHYTSLQLAQAGLRSHSPYCKHDKNATEA
jgi:hypothetical protein